MGIQSFTASSSGLPGLSFVGQATMTTAFRDWAQAGGPGNYTVKSARGEAGYVYFVGPTTVGGPLNGVVNVPAAFTSIKLIGAAGDLLSLYKVSVKTTTSFSTTAAHTTYTSTVTGQSLATNKTGFIDALLVGGGGGRSHHGGGAGGGGVLIINSFPLDPSKTFDVQVGNRGSDNANGGDTIFAGTKAAGGGGGTSDNQQTGRDGGCGSGGSGQTSNLGGKSTQGTGTAAVSSPILFYSSYGSIATAQGYGHPGNPGNGSNHGGHGSNHGHNGGGGGGAGGPASTRNGGPGIQLNFDGTGNKYYAAGGFGGTHSSQGHGNAGTGWNDSAGHYGMGGCAYDNSYGPHGTAGVVIVRSYNI